MTEPADKPEPPKPVLSYRSAPRTEGDWGQQSHWTGKVTAIVLALPIILYIVFELVGRIRALMN